jgi:hypothetical protein
MMIVHHARKQLSAPESCGDEIGYEKFRLETLSDRAEIAPEARAHECKLWNNKRERRGVGCSDITPRFG